MTRLHVAIAITIGFYAVSCACLWIMLGYAVCGRVAPEWVPWTMVGGANAGNVVLLIGALA